METRHLYWTLTGSSFAVCVLYILLVPVPGPVMVVGWDLEKECDDLVEIHDLDRIAHIVWLEI
jgi:hypothetical protein